MKKIIHCTMLLAIFTVNAMNTDMTQSEAHMSVPANKELVEKWYKIEKNSYFKELYNKAVSKEKELNNSHNVFYTGFINEWRLPQDLYLKLYTKLHPLSIDAEGLKNYRAFRWIPVEYQSPTEFLKKELKEHGLVQDTQQRLRAFLLSTNLAFFGNVGNPGSCTFDYFLSSTTHVTVKDAVFKTILDIFDDPTMHKKNTSPILYKYIPQIQALTQNLKPEPLTTFDNKTYYPQTISQIFIPKNITDDVSYLAWSQGTPFDERLISLLEEDKQHIKQQTSQSLRSADWLANLRKVFVDQQASHPLFQQIILQGIEEGRYSIVKALETYKKSPATVSGINRLQARLMIMPKHINIGSDIKVFDYDRISEDNKKTYETKLNAIVDAMFKDILAQAKERTENPITTVETKPVLSKQILRTIQQNIDQLIINAEEDVKKSRTHNNETDLLQRAVLAKQTSQAIQLIQSIPNAHLITLPHSNLPLAFAAIKNKNLSIIDALIANGLDANSSYNVNDTVITLLDYATIHASNSIAQMLINSSATATPQTKNIAQVLTRKTILQILP